MADVIVIGGGVSGLSAGIYSLMSGNRVKICEKNPNVGGNLTAWRRGEYQIDNCIHWLTGTNPSSATYKMWCDLGALGDVGIYQAESLFTCEHDGESLTLYRSLDRTINEMISKSPKDKHAVRNLKRAVQAIQHISGIGGEYHDEGVSFLGAAADYGELLRYYRMSAGELAEHFKSPLIQSFVTAITGKEFAALAFLTVIATFCGNNGGVPCGGSLAMAERMRKRFLSLGGEILTNAEVVKLEKRGKRIRSVLLSDGREIPADFFAISIDPMSFFGKLVDAEMPKALAKQYADPKYIRFSSVQCAFSCELEKVPFSGDLVLDVHSASDRAALGYDRIIFREFSHEGDFSPEGKNIIQSMVFCTEQSAREMIALSSDGDAYEEMKIKTASIAGKILCERYPELNGKIRCIDIWTPATYHRFTGSDMGSYMGFIMPTGVMPKKLDVKINGLKNAFLATQWLQCPGGLPIAAESGRRAAKKISSMSHKR